jgi:acetyl-CoA acetyltransferase
MKFLVLNYWVMKKPFIIINKAGLSGLQAAMLASIFVMLGAMLVVGAMAASGALAH